MITDAVNTTGDLNFVYPNWLVLLSPDDQPPKINQTVDGEDGQGDGSVNALSVGLNALEVVQSAGGGRLDFASLEWALTGHLANRTQPADFTRMVSVRLPDVGQTSIHLGDYVRENLSIKPDGETLTAVSELRPYHFGNVFAGQVWYDKLSGAQIVTSHGPIFNPEVDGVILGNQSSYTQINNDAAKGFVWTHPEAARTTNAQTYTGETPTEWSLELAVQTICDLCNPNETIIANPDATERSKLANAPSLKDVSLPVGQYLPFYLDRLLHPLGFNWFLDYETDPDKPAIKLFEKGVGTVRSLYFQQPTDVLDLADSNVNHVETMNAIGDSVNQVRVDGDFEEAEVTVPLFPTWAESKDSLTAADLDREDGASYTGNEDVHRKWAANEAGDYDGVREYTGVASVPDLSTVFTKYAPHRQRAEDPLTYMGDSDALNRRPFFIEYNVGEGWKELPDSIAGDLKLLPDEIGIYFDGDQPPTELVDAIQAAEGDGQIRLTCTLRGDARISSTAAKQSSAVNGRTVELVLDRPDKFQKRWVQQTGDYASELAGSYSGADERDDSSAIATYAQELRDLYEVAELDCSFRLPGWHLHYQIGDLIDNIDGREISLDQASPSAAANRYVQVTGRRFGLDDAAGPFTILTVDRGTRRA